MGQKGVNERDKGKLDQYKDLSVGELLMKSRQARGLSLPQVADLLKIREVYLDALERDDISILPGRVYAIGFVRSYAAFLNLDEDKLVYLFKNQKVGHENKRHYKMPLPLDDGHLPNKKIIFICVAVLVTFVLWGTVFNKKDNNDVLPLPAEQTEIGDTEDDQSERIEQDGRLDKQDVHEWFEIRAVAESWVSVKTLSGETISAKLMKAGDVVKVPAGEKATVNTGNAGGIEIFFSGEKTSYVGVNGEVRKNIKLNSDLLKTLQSDPNLGNE